MNNDIQTMLMLTWILMAASGIFAYKSVLAIQGWFELRRRRKMYASLVESTEENICQGPHKWDTIKLALSGLPVDRYMVCTECGNVATQEANVKLNGPGLEIYRNELKIRAEREAKFSAKLKQKQEETDKLMNQMIKSFYSQLDGDKAQQVALLQQFFRKSVMELDSLYARLNKELDEENGNG